MISDGSNDSYSAAGAPFESNARIKCFSGRSNRSDILRIFLLLATFLDPNITAPVRRDPAPTSGTIRELTDSWWTRENKAMVDGNKLYVYPYCSQEMFVTNWDTVQRMQRFCPCNYKLRDFVPVHVKVRQSTTRHRQDLGINTT